MIFCKQLPKTIISTDMLVDSHNNGVSSDSSSDYTGSVMSIEMPLYFEDKIEHGRTRYPHCIVWTPIPCLTYVSYLTSNALDPCNAFW